MSVRIPTVNVIRRPVPPPACTADKMRNPQVDSTAIMRRPRNLSDIHPPRTSIWQWVGFHSSLNEGTCFHKEKRPISGDDMNPSWVLSIWWPCTDERLVPDPRIGLEASAGRTYIRIHTRECEIPHLPRDLPPHALTRSNDPP